MLLQRTAEEPNVKAWSSTWQLGFRVWKVFGVILVHLVIIEALLRTVNLVFPLERPVHLQDSYTNEWLEGGAWFNGATRLYIYKPNTNGTTNGHPFRINRWGFRGNDFLERDRGGWRTYRIMVLGDSNTVGIGVAEEDRYTNVLETMLRERYPTVKIEVINLAVQGFETLQEEKIMHRMWTVVDPDLTIVGFSVNDPNISYDFYLPYKLPVPERLRQTFERSLLFRQLELRYDPLYRRVHQLPTHKEEIMRAYNPESRDWKIFVQSVQSIAKWVKSHTDFSPFVILLKGGLEAEQKGQYQQARDIFVHSGFLLSEVETGHYHAVSRFDGHPNEETHRWYAKALFRTIVERNLIAQK